MDREKVLESLEFNRLLEIIAEYTNNETSRKAVLSISPLKNIEDIKQRFSLIEEIRTMSRMGSPLHIGMFPDISSQLQKVRPEGAVLDPFELSGIMIFLDISLSILNQIRSSRLPFLNRFVADITGHPEVLNLLKRSIDENGNILDSASSNLAELRREIKRLEQRIRKRLEEIVADESIAVFLQDDFITQRSGRWVIPVRMDSKGQVQGIVHDVSRSGETAFMEPIGIISLSNEHENLIAEAKTEEIRILREISSKIRAIASEIDSEYKCIVYIDLLNSIAIFADRLKMEPPSVNEQDPINLIRARHPLLTISLQNSEKTVVPINVTLGGDNRVMVITGPNAGGKTIAIKTIGLLVLMALSGMPVPADSSSSIPFVSNLLVDIGDQQSIEHNLSTFSAHISNISEILRETDSRTLILIDELGTGTDPDEGAAIACALLREFKQKGALVFATTHLTDIKGFVHRESGMINASMEFDLETLTPLYNLRVGEPGQSHAFDTARRFGLPDYIIESAKNILGTRKIELDNLIHDINEKRRNYESAHQQLIRKEAELQEEKRYIEDKKAETEAIRKDIMAKAYKEALDIIADTKRQMRVFLEEMKKADREKAKELVKDVVAIQTAVADKAKGYLKKEKGIYIDSLKEGALVFIRSINHEATILKVSHKDNRIRVRSGSIEFDVPVSDVDYIIGDTKTEHGIIKLDTPERAESILNLVGLRVDYAISRLEPFLNQATMAGLSEITIIHGIGTGALKTAVRGHLRGHPLVRGFRPGTQKEGGEGVTVVRLL